ncbi:MAG: hypothetical protein IJA67_07720 [Oscillospiraceae bacterium]|nr:hypothetical protein [Oscillospiraceae bacterium]
MGYNRKNMRLEGFDYSSPGSYFITICTKHRHKILCDIVGGGALDAPSVHLTKIGLVVQKHIERINICYTDVQVDKYVIMPNHVHLLLTIPWKNIEQKKSTPANAIIPRTISSFKTFVTKEIGYPIFQRSDHDHIVRNEYDYGDIWNYIDTNPRKWQEDRFYEP